MFWKLTALSAASPVESILDKEDFTLEELLDEEDIIQECRALNSRLINFLRERAQVERLLRFIVEESPEDADSKRAFKFPFISSEVLTCEIDVILKTLVEEEELMDLLFSFLEPNRSHSVMLAGYFSKVVICLMLRKTVPLMNYVKYHLQAHQNVFQQLVDLIGITSIMEVLIRLVSADDHVYPNHVDVMQWLADSNLLEMIVDKLSPSNSLEVHGNAAETLCTIAQNAPSPLATKLSSSSFVARIFGHAFGDPPSKSSLVHTLSVCISLLSPRRSLVSSPFMYSFRGQQIFESPISVNPETIATMLPRLGDFVALLNVTSDEKVLPTTYGQLRPPLGSHRLKIVEFIAVLLKTRSEATGKVLATSGAIRRVLDLFFEYPYNNALHHQVESIIVSCLESKNEEMIDHLLRECDLIGKILKIEKQPILSGDNQPTIPAAGKQAPRVGNIGHISRISNKLVQLSTNSNPIKTLLEEHNEWGEWEANTLHDRNTVENVYRWVCGRPTALHDRTRDSDDEEVHDRDYDLAGLANNLNQFTRYNMQENNGAEEEHGSNDRDEEDVYFDDESAEVVVSSLRLGDEQANNLFANSNWFTFQGDELGENTRAGGIPSEEAMEDVSLDETSGNGDEEEDCLITESKNPFVATASTSEAVSVHSIPGGIEIDEDVVSDESSPERVERGDASSPTAQVKDPFPEDDVKMPDVRVSNGSSSSEGEISPRSPPVPSLFEKDIEFVGVEPEGTERAMDQALKEGIVGEAGPMKRSSTTASPGKESSDENMQQEYNDTNYWKVDQEVAVVE
ncbi:serine/threonine-protein phosphatase 6 regulatory subunit 3-like isoform X1 [Brassica napus]|uniref:serine/threonine-protein phosphatase 6 regulatory subunit 3-like isoform X1 n=1 Tax=Brassica napus TaxID=3708 RepID=UPI00207AD068|nr:serine/threonine-protein phosphatase 6 regulatory subunit 3-like isoform X1 [Brassica napus]XP_048607188.1 serine/threonine-protein phosphatase 6 regulatory subunit 3-like isoform X1 [Brassica napus]